MVYCDYAVKSITLAAGSIEMWFLFVERKDPGNYTVDVDGLSGSFTVVALVKPPGINWPLIGGIIASVVVVGLVIYFLVVRRRAAWLLEKLGEIQKLRAKLKG